VWVMPPPTVAAAPRPNTDAQQIQQQAQQRVQQVQQAFQEKANATHATLTQRAQDTNRTLLAQRSSSGVRPYQPAQQSSFEAPRPDFASRLQGLPSLIANPGNREVQIQRQSQVNGQPPVSFQQTINPAQPQAPGQRLTIAQPQSPVAPPQQASPFAGLHTLFGDLGKLGGASAAQAKGLDGALSAMDGSAPANGASPAYSMRSMQESKGSFSMGDGGTLTYDIINMNFQPAPQQPSAAQPATTAPPADAAAAAPKPISDADKAWLQKVGGNNYAEVQLGKLALQQGTSDAVQAFGEHMVTDHGKGYADTQKLAASYGVEVPNQLNAEQQTQYDQLASLSGSKFDQAYTDAMTQAHFKSIASYATEASTTTDPAIKDFATKKLAKAEDHLADIQGVAQGKVPEEAAPATPSQPQEQAQGGFNVSESHLTFTTQGGTSLSYDAAKVSPDSQQAQGGGLDAQGTTTSLQGPNGVGMELHDEKARAPEA